MSLHKILREDIISFQLMLKKFLQRVCVYLLLYMGIICFEKEIKSCHVLYCLGRYHNIRECYKAYFLWLRDENNGLKWTSCHTKLSAIKWRPRPLPCSTLYLGRSAACAKDRAYINRYVYITFISVLIILLQFSFYDDK